jgi:hypothetical protein
MNSKLVLGIVLLSLLALTGVVSAVPVGKAMVSGDIPPTLELTVRGDVSNWQLTDPPSDKYVVIDVTNIGNENGYHIMVADKMDPDRCGNPKPAGSEGHMTVYKDSSCTAGWGYVTPTHQLAMPLWFWGVGPMGYLELSGTDQLLLTNPDPWTNSYVIDLQQPLAVGEKPASIYGGNGYRIIVTFTVLPN